MLYNNTIIWKRIAAVAVVTSTVAILLIRCKGSTTDRQITYLCREIKNLAENDEVFAAGFVDDANGNDQGKPPLKFNTGKITLLLDKSFQGGYRIGYTNDIQKGMSGGPILNNRGELIGINGVNAYPLFGDPYVFEDGSKPNDALKEKMTRSSWGVPIQTVVQQLPELTAPNPVKDTDNIAKNITVLITQQKDPDDNGSGVIIARQGSTYYILTAAHVLRNETTYEVTTPDGRCYPVDYHIVKKTEGTDLAVLQFFSSETYPVATLGKYDYGEHQIQLVFVNGWVGSRQGIHSKPSRLFTPGFIVKGTNSKEASLQIRDPSPSSDSNEVSYKNVTPPQEIGSSGLDPVRQTIGASIPRIPVSTFLQVTNPGSLSNGYGMVYTNITAPGVSGGPVLDARGQVIGIHGSEDGFEDKENNRIQNNSLGIPMSTFLSQISLSQLGIKRSDLKVETAASTLLNKQQFSEIVHYLLSIPKKPKDSANALEWFNYGNQLWQVDKNKEAIRHLQTLDFSQGITSVPDSFLEMSIEALDKAIQRKKKFFAAWYTKGLIFKFQAKYPESKASFDQAIALFDKETPNAKAFTWRDQARVLSHMEKYQEALASVDHGINLKPNIDEFTLHILYVDRSYVLLNLKLYAEAKDAATESINLSPDYLAYYNRGVAKAKLEDDKQAIKDYNQALKLQPDYPEAYSDRCQSHANLKEYTQAIKDCDQAIKLKPDSVISYDSRGSTHLQLQDYKHAIDDYNQAIKLKPDSYILYSHRGTAYYTLGLNDKKQAPTDFNRAIADFNRAIKLQPNYALAYVTRGNAYSDYVKWRNAYSDLKMHKQAFDDFNQAIKLQSNNANAYLSRGLAHEQWQEYPEAIEDYSQGIKLQPNEANTYLQRGYVRTKLSPPDYKGAIKDYTQGIIKLQHNNTNAGSNAYLQPLAYLARGYVRTKLSPPDYKGAIEDYTQGIKFQPNEANAYLQRGYVRTKLSPPDYKGAIEDYTQGIKFQPNEANAYLQRGDVRKSLSDYKGAIEDYTQGIKLQPNNANAYLARGDARMQLPKPDYQGASTDYTQVIKLQHNNANAKVYSHRGVANRELKNYKEAIADFNQVIKLEPNNPNAYFALGVVYHIQQDYDAAFSQYNQALAKDKKFLPAITNIGYIKYEKGDVEGAIQQWQTVVNTDSNLAEPQMAMAVAFYAKGEQEKGLNMAQAALRLDKSWANLETLKKNLWGKRLVADAQKVLSHLSM